MKRSNTLAKSMFFVLCLLTGTWALAEDCDKPINISAEQLSDSSVKITWNAVQNSSGYFIRIKEGDDNPHDFEIEKDIYTNWFIVEGLVPSHNYEFRARTLCGEDHSNWSEDFEFRSASDDDSHTGTCTTPAGLIVTNVTDSSATISWNTVDGAENYELEVEDGDNTPPFNFNVVTGSTSFVVTGLAANGEYKVKVKSKCSGGNNSEYTEWLFFNASNNGGGGNPGSGNCTTPTGLMVVNVTDSSATISWNAVDGAENYELEVEDGDNTPPFNFNVVTGSTSFVVTGLAANGEYKVKVKSKCSGGNNSEYTEWLFFNASNNGGGGNPGSGNCTTPTGLMVVNVTDSSATISWNTVDGAENYELEVEDGDNTPPFNFNVVTGSTSFVVTGLAANGEYKVKVKSKCSGGNNSEYTEWLFFNASNSGGGGNPGSGNCTTPTGLMIVNVTDSSATISWNAVDGAENYELEVEDGDNTPAFNFNVVTGSTSFVVTGLADNGEYKVKVKSKCSGGNNSGYTEWLFFNASNNGGGGNPGSGNCTTPTGLMIVNVTDSSATISWNAVDGAENYELEVEDGDNTPPFNFNVVTGSTSFAVTGLAANGEYKVKVKSKCSGGNNSEYTEWLFFNASNNGGGGNPGSGNCTTPTGLMIVNVTDSSATISWNIVDGAENYELEVEDGDNTPPFNFNVVTNDTSFVVTGLAPNGAYKVKVKTKCSGGNNSEYTAWLFFSALEQDPDSTDCLMPTNISVSALTDSTARLTWFSVPGVFDYILEFEEVTDSASFRFTIATADTTLVVLELKPETAYRFRLRSRCAESTSSGRTAWINFITEADDGFVDTEEDIVVRIEHIRPNQAKVAWTPTVNAYAYQITIEGTSPNTAGFYRQGIVEENQFDALGLEPNASYRVEVKASLEDGELGTSSAPAFFMTASLPEALYTFQAFPNPASNFIQLNFAEETREKMSLIQVIDDQGRIRKQFPASDFTGQGLHIPIVDLPNGMYVIVIRHKDQRTFRKQLMIAR